jgi:hypothetical protein
MHWTFGTFLWAMLLAFFWVCVIWMFIAVFADIVRRDMSGWAKAGWIVLIIVLPFIGILAYVIAAPKRVAYAGGDIGFAGERPPATEYSASDAIAAAARLQDQGKITADEYERLKQRALSHA